MNNPAVMARKDAKAAGLTRYFTGTPCKYGHIAERWSAGGSCTQCHELKINRVAPPTCEQKKATAQARAKRWYEANKAKTIARAKEWKRDNPEAIAEGYRRWRKKDHARSICFMRDSLRRVLKTEKNGRTEKILGYTRFELLSHIESLFFEGMSWDNHGEWHIDHKHPISAYLAAGEKDPAVINALSNLRPLWALENISKGARLE